MAKFIATWICIDSKEDGTYFPSSKGYSSDIKVQNVYWKCVVTFFASAQKFIKDEKLVLFTNTRHFPAIEGINIEILLERLNVSIIYVEFNYKLPKGYFNSWTNQFFEFSILDYVAAKFDSDDMLLMLDSDCVFLKEVGPLFSLCMEKQCITYVLPTPVNEVINGLSRLQMKHVFETLLGYQINEVPDYHAGEFFMAKAEIIKKFLAQFRSVWPSLLRLNEEGKPKLIEEAHVLSYLYFVNKFNGGEANKYIKRIWTDPTTFRNAEIEDDKLVIWHIPAEKKFGIDRLFQLFKKQNFDLRQMSDFQYHEIVGRELNIPFIPFKRKIFFFVKKTVKLFVKMSQSNSK